MNFGFRHWVAQKWYEYQAECEAWLITSPDCINANDYFKTNRWFLKKKYKEEAGNGFQNS